MTTLFAVIGILAGLAISHVIVYRWGRNSLKKEIYYLKINNDELANEIGICKRRLKIAINKPSAGDVNPIDIM